MSSSSPAPKLPIWIFLATDAALLTAAAYIAAHAPRPLSDSTTFAIVACLIGGAIIGLVPLVAYYERQKNETLDDRQRALEALARTIENSAEQISIAAGGLHEMADIAQRNLKHAEQLPQKLQEKMAEFQAQLANASDTEKEELEKEVEELRASETDRLQTTFDRVAKTAAEFAKLETSLHQQLAGANDAVAKLSAGSAAAVTKAQTAAEQVVVHAREQAAKAVGDAAAEAMKELERAKGAAVRELTAQFEVNIARIRETTQQLGAAIDRLQTAPPAVAPATAAPAQPAVPEPVAEPATAAPPSTPSTVEAGPSHPAHTPASAETAAGVTPPTKRSRKPRREEPVPAAAAVEMASAAAGVTEPGDTKPAVSGVGEPGQQPTDSVVKESPATSADADKTQHSKLDVAGLAEPAHQPANTAGAKSGATPAPVAANGDNGSAATAVRERGHAPAAKAPVEHNGAAAPAAEAGAVESAAAKPARKRTTPKPQDDQPGLELDLGDAAPSPTGMVERVISSDGATRLIVTAYIGIGNRLFIRGNGPGLSWDKGVPLQFVSIGKWRWETNDASGPLQVKLFKNDVQESAGLGALTIDPGHQHEVTANFN